VQKTPKKRTPRHTIARPKVVRYARKDMGRPPQPPRSYVTRHIRVQRELDAAIRRLAVEERRGYNDLVHILLEDCLKDRARKRGERFELPPRRQPRKSPRKP